MGVLEGGLEQVRARGGPFFWRCSWLGMLSRPRMVVYVMGGEGGLNEEGREPVSE